MPPINQANAINTYNVTNVMQMVDNQYEQKGNINQNRCIQLKMFPLNFLVLAVMPNVMHDAFIHIRPYLAARLILKPIPEITNYPPK